MSAPITVCVDSPLGPLAISGTPAGISAVRYMDAPTGTHTPPNDLPAPVQAYMQQLADYFAGTRRAFDVPLALAGTPFQQRVWAAVQRIPFGETRAYLQIAGELGNPQAVRAVGGANSRNPAAILVPCHRVIGSSGDITGYAGGLWRKQWLLAHEGHLFQQALF